MMLYEYTMRDKWLIIFLLSAMGVSAQRYPHAVGQYDFIRYDSNVVQRFNDVHPMRKLYDRLDAVTTTGKGQVNILHFGGSHLQADIWSGQLREHFQQIQPGMQGARGMVFPFDIARTNNPPNYTTKYTGVWYRKRSTDKKEMAQWGITGMQVSTYDSLASFTIITRMPSQRAYDFSRVRIFCDINPSSYSIRLPARDVDAVISVDTLTRCIVIDFPSYRDTLTVHMHKTDSLQRSFQLYGVQFENDDPGVIYHAMGVNGADVSAYLRCTQLGTQLPAVAPDLVIFSVGINDAYTTRFKADVYRSRYDSLIRVIRAVYPDVSILFTTNNDSYYKKKYPNRNVYEVAAVMRSLSKEYNCAVWNLFEVMGGLGSISQWESLDLAKSDKIHFKAGGYRLVADLMFSAIMTDYQAYLKTARR